MAHWTEQVFLEDPDRFGEFQENRAERSSEEVDDLLDLLRAHHGHQPQDVFDVACGIGRHLVPFAQRGLEVHGLDISTEYLDRARERVADAGVTDRVTLLEGDMRELGNVGGSFDLVTSFWNSVGYFEDAENRSVFDGMYERVAPGGVLVLELTNREAILANFDDGSVGGADGELHAEQFEYDPETGRMTTTLHVLNTDDDVYEGSLSWELRLYAPVELRQLLHRVGFDRVELYAGLDGEPIERESTTLVAVAKRGG